MKCQICKIGISKLIRTITKLKRAFPLYHCDNCGCYFIYPVPNDEFLIKWYSSKRKFERLIKADTLSRDKNIYPQYWNIISSKVSLNGEADVLEIGSYSGAFLNRFKEIGHKTLGIELNDTFIDYSKIYYDLEILKGTIFDVDLSQKFGIIVCNQILEHQAKPYEFLEKVSDFLEENGYICISVPNVEAGLIEDIPNHLYYFTEQSLRILFKKLKLKVLAIKKYGDNDRGLFAIVTNYKKKGKTVKDDIDSCASDVQSE